MTRPPVALIAALIAASMAAMLAGCDSLPGKPTEADRPINPADVKSFASLYGQNCAGCHGARGSFGPATELANPTYQAIIDDASLTRIVSQGMPGTAMPPFAHNSGGFLSPEQIQILVSGMRVKWKTGGPLQGAPPYAGVAGDAGHGAAVFAQSCAPCHGPDGTGGAKAPGSIVERSYLTLVSDQALRTLIIAGRPDLGHPDWRGYSGQPLTGQQVADVVAWMASRRPRFVPGNYARNP